MFQLDASLDGDVSEERYGKVLICMNLLVWENDPESYVRFG